MPFIVVCVDKENPANSILCTYADLDGVLPRGMELEDVVVFPNKVEAEKWVTKDEGLHDHEACDYHFIEVK